MTMKSGIIVIFLKSGKKNICFFFSPRAGRIAEFGDKNADAGGGNGSKVEHLCT